MSDHLTISFEFSTNNLPSSAGKAPRKHLATKSSPRKTAVPSTIYRADPADDLDESENEKTSDEEINRKFQSGDPTSSTIVNVNGRVFRKAICATSCADSTRP